ncbi:MAG: hypothetical protein FJ145_16015 [Deltaproteobacteria bacterium]|nr:hypothetical protein [Deltaproteobacteria bacterium]
MAGRLIYSTTIFLNAVLLFWVQPLVGKMILPLAGGAPAVWNTCLFFFQGTLLAGYVYAHLGSRTLGSRRHGVLHLALVAAAIFFLPIAFGKEALVALERYPATAILGALATSVGFPFFILSAGSPLLQKWFAETGHADAVDPYSLYAASNLGSFIGLILYPALLEPFLTLSEQNQLWVFGYGSLVLLLLLCAGPLLRAKSVVPQIDPATTTAIVNEPLSLWRRLRWLLWSFAPSTLLLGVTTYVTTDVASVPLFWIVPLSLYLLSFVLAFARPRWAIHSLTVRLQGLLVCVSVVNYFAEAVKLPWLVAGLHLITFFVTAVVCHGRLAGDRPPTQYLTEFYLWISLGGMLGGLFNSLIAPRIFLRLQEYPLAIIVAVMLRPHLVRDSAKAKVNFRDFLWPALLGAVYYFLARNIDKITWLPDQLETPLLFALAALACISFAHRPLRFGLGLLAVFLASSINTDSATTLFRGRSFFGVYRVSVNSSATRNSLLHGTTLHGTQNLDPKQRTTAISYYYPTGPIGQIFQTFAQPRKNANVGLVGLGSGGLACYAKPGQSFTFFEIDPLIERIARDPKLFTYLRDCPARLSIVIGDARVSLTRSPSRHFDLLVLDAFSSDAIPIHLLTQEALQLYLTKLTHDGIMAIHISNRYLDLEPVLGRLADELKLFALVRADSDHTEQEREHGKFSSTWVVMTRAQKSLEALRKDERWQMLDSGPDLWTDSYSNILRVIKWR